MRTLVSAVVCGFVLAGGLPVAAQDGAGDTWDTPGVQLVLSGGTSMFRGPDGDTEPFLLFDPQESATTFGVALGFRLANHFVLEVAADGTRGDSVDDDDDDNDDDRSFGDGSFAEPDTYTGTIGLRLPFPLGRGRLVPYLSLGGGLYHRSTNDGFEDVFEEAFDTRNNDPLAYAGAGLEYRFTGRFGLRADYRYMRVFTEDIEDIEFDREALNIHRVTAGLTLGF